MYGESPSVVKCPVVPLRICWRQYVSAIADASGSRSTGASPFAARSRLIICRNSLRSAMRVSSTGPSPCASGVAAAIKAKTRISRFIERLIVGAWPPGRPASSRNVATTAMSPGGQAARHLLHRQFNIDTQTGVQILSLNPTTMVFNRFARDCKAEAGAGRLRGKVRIEDLRQHFGRDAGTVVFDGDDHFRIDRCCPESHASVRRGLE